MLCNSTDRKAQIKWRLQLLICTTMETSKLTTDDIISETVYIVVRMSDREFPIYFHYLIKSPPAIWMDRQKSLYKSEKFTNKNIKDLK